MERIFMHDAHRARTAPSLSVSHWLNTDGSIHLEKLRGRVVVLCAFQMLCPNSVRHGLPQALRIREAFDEDDVEVLGLHPAFESNGSSGALALAAFLLQYGVDIPVAIDSDSTMESYGIAGTPSLVLIDRRGRLRAHVFGRPSDMQVGANVASLISEDRPRPVIRGRRPRLITPMDTAFAEGYGAAWPSR